MKPSAFVLLALGVAGAAVVASRLSGGPSVASSGQVVLQPRVPYRLTLESEDTLIASPMTPELQNRQNEVRTELLSLSAYDIVFERTLTGTQHVVFQLTPLFPIPLSIGAQLNSTGTWGPKLILTRVERLDGQPL